MNTEKYSALSEKILSYIRKGIKNEDLISNLVFEGYAYKDIVFVMNALINEGKIRGGNIVGKEDASEDAKSIDDAFLSNDKEYSNSGAWVGRNRKFIIMGISGFLGFLFIGSIFGFIFYNAPERQLSRAFSKIFDLDTFSYEIVMEKNFSNKGDINFDKSVIDLDGSIILNNLNRGVSIKSKSYLNEDLVEEINIKNTFLNPKEAQEYYSLVNKFNDLELKNILNQWVKYDSISKLFNILPDISNKYFVYFLKGVSNLDGHKVSKIKDIFVDKNSFSDIDIYKDSLDVKNISFSLKDMSSIELENIIRDISKISDIRGQFLNDCIWIVKLDDKGYLSDVFIKSKNSDLNFINIKFSNFNFNFEISNPNEFIEISDSF